MSDTMTTKKLQKFPIKMKGDPLEFIFVHHKILFSHKIITPLVFTFSSIGILVSTISSVSIINSEGFGEFVKKYSLCITTSLYIGSIFLFEYCYLMGSKMDKIMKREFYWDIKTASPSVRKKMHKQIRLVFVAYVVFVIINSSFAFSCILLGFLSDVKLFSDIIYIENILASYHILKLILKFILGLAHFSCTITSISLYLLLEYGSVTIKIQLDLLSNFLNQVNIYKSSEDKHIREHLKICSKHHIFICGLLQVFQSFSGFSIIALILSGSLSVIGCLMFIYYSNYLIDNLLVSLLLTWAAFLLVDVSKRGQEINDAFDEFAVNLMNLKWYNWNESNKKSLLLMMIRTQKSAAIAAFDVQVNRPLVIKVLRTVYQICLLIQRTM